MLLLLVVITPPELNTLDKFEVEKGSCVKVGDPAFGVNIGDTFLGVVFGLSLISSIK